MKKLFLILALTLMTSTLCLAACTNSGNNAKSRENATKITATDTTPKTEDSALPEPANPENKNGNEKRRMLPKLGGKHRLPVTTDNTDNEVGDGTTGETPDEDPEQHSPRLDIYLHIIKSRARRPRAPHKERTCPDCEDERFCPDCDDNN